MPNERFFLAWPTAISSMGLANTIDALSLAELRATSAGSPRPWKIDNSCFPRLSSAKDLRAEIAAGLLFYELQSQAFGRTASLEEFAQRRQYWNKTCGA